MLVVQKGVPVSRLEARESNTARYWRSVKLSKKGDFSSVFSYRCLIRSLHFSVFVRPNQSWGRLGISIGKKVAIRAVDRNYMKRVIREFFRSDAVIFVGMDVVVQLRQKFSQGIYAEIRHELLTAVAHARKKC